MKTINTTHASFMRYLLYLKALLIILTAAVMTVSFPAQASPPAGQNWNVVLDDEFTNDTTLDTTIWGSGTTPWGSEAQGSCDLIRSQDTYLTANGLVNVTESGSFTGGTGTAYSYADGWVWLQPSQWRTYGYLEIKAQYPNEQGAWPAFWMLQSGWPPEIDIAEYRGAPKSYMTHAFYDGAWHTSTTPDTGGSFTGWHTYGLDWEPGSLKWYIDGVLKKTYTGSTVPSTPMYAILSGGNSCTDANGTGFPNNFTIAYFRWYQIAPPTSPPPAPTGLTAGPVSTSEIDLNWNADTGATSSYNVKRATVSGGPYSTVAMGVTTTSYADTTVSGGTTYYYVVSAVNSIGESPNSAEASAMPQVPSLIPPNSGFEAPVTSTYIYNPSGGSWTFSPSGSGTGSGVTANGSGFTAGNANAPEGVQVAFLQGTGTITQSIPGFTSGTTYTVEFFASQRQNKSGGQAGETFNVTVNGTSIGTFEPPQSSGSYAQYLATFTASASSQTLAFVGTDLHGGDNTVFLDNVRFYSSAPPPPPPAPTGLGATAASSSQINLSWIASSGATSYNVKRATVNGGPYTTIATGVTATSYSDTGLSASTAYYYVVSAVNANGESANSAQASATTLSGGSVPPAPTGLTATAGNAQVSLSWTASSGATSYNVKRATFSGGPYTTVATGVTTTSYVNTGLANGTTYYYVVSAVNAVGESPNSSQVSATPTGGGAVLLSQSKPVTASSSTGSHPASSGNDGSLSTRWKASSSSYPQWWRVDLGAGHSLSQVVINWYNTSSANYQYKIEVSSDDVTYTTVVDQTGRTGFGDTTDNFSATGRYVRITMTGSMTGSTASFYECKVYGN